MSNQSGVKGGESSMEQTEVRSELLTRSTIHADETVMRVRKEKGRTAISESRRRVYSSAKRAGFQLGSVSAGNYECSVSGDY